MDRLATGSIPVLGSSKNTSLGTRARGEVRLSRMVSSSTMLKLLITSPFNPKSLLIFKFLPCRIAPFCANTMSRLVFPSLLLPLPAMLLQMQ